MRKPHVTRVAAVLVAVREEGHGPGPQEHDGSPPQEQVMIPLIPTAETAGTPFAGWNFPAIVRGMLQSWISHHQRLAEAGIGGDL